ncbi:hypothetical protein A9Q94_20770 [Rhodobacterales bacterium 56_14_T64]|nr:hypothetical protein A9Q94_20770 [Rhodobacterales bacterium 56_14_T64]
MKQPKKGRLWLNLSLNLSLDIAAQCPNGQWMDPEFGCVPSIAIMSGRTTLAIVARNNGALNNSNGFWG